LYTFVTGYLSLVLPFSYVWIPQTQEGTDYTKCNWAGTFSVMMELQVRGLRNYSFYSQQRDKKKSFSVRIQTGSVACPASHFLGNKSKAALV
jgi:hypothetical protein